MTSPEPPPRAPPAALQATPAVALERVSKAFDVGGRALLAIEAVDLAVPRGQFVAIVGASGCGKSTLLNMVGGLERPTGGRVLVDGRPVERPGRDRGFVFQSFSLFPWMTVRGNVAFALEKSRLPRAEADARVARTIEAVGLRGFEDAWPRQLSGGMRQRVAIARALVYRPSVLLMDEPFGALDAQTRGLMGELLLRVWDEGRATVLFVTHDVDEAIVLADRVVVMASRPGRVKRDIPVPLPRPREPAMLTDPAFVAVKREVLALIREEALRAMAAEGGGAPA